MEEGWTDRQTTCWWGLAGLWGCQPPLHSTSRGGRGESCCCCSGKRPVPSSPPRGNPDLTFRSRQSHQRPGQGPGCTNPLVLGGDTGRDPQPSSPLPPPHPLPLQCCWARTPRWSRSCPGSLPASGRGGHGGVTSSPNRRFPPALGTASCASQPSPGLLLLLPQQTPNKHNTGEAPSILPASPGDTEAHKGPTGNSIAAGSTWVPDPRLTGVQFLLCPAFYRPFPPHRSIARQRGATLWLLTAHCFRATARGHLSGLKSHQCLAPGIFPSPRVEGAPCPSALLRTLGCFVPQFPWLRGSQQHAHPIQKEMKGTLSPPPAAQFLPPEESGPAQLLSWSPALPGCWDTPNQFRAGMHGSHPKASGWGGVSTPGPSPCTAPMATLQPALGSGSRGT